MGRWPIEPNIGRQALALRGRGLRSGSANRVRFTSAGNECLRLDDPNNGSVGCELAHLVHDFLRKPVL